MPDKFKVTKQQTPTAHCAKCYVAMCYFFLIHLIINQTETHEKTPIRLFGIHHSSFNYKH